MTFTGQVQVDFAHDPTSASYTWTDLTSRAQSAQYRRGRSYELGEIQAGSGSLALKNTDGAFDPANGSSPYSPNVLPYKRIQHNITIGATTYPVFTGLVERWPQEWNAQYGTSPIQVVDYFGWLALAKLRTALQQEILAGTPLIYLPLTDDQSVSVPASVVAPVNASIEMRTTLGGASDATFSFASGAGPVAEGTKALSTTLSTSGAQGWGVHVAGASFTFTGTRQYIRINYTSPIASPPAAQGYLFALNGDAGTPRLAALVNNTDGKILINTIDPSGVGGASLSSTTSICDAHPHDIVIECIHATTTINIYIDGVLSGTNASQKLGSTYTYTNLAIAGFWSPFHSAIQLPAAGTFSHFAIYDTASTISATAQFTAGSTGFAGDTADARIARILGYAGWTAATSLDACTTTMLAADLNGKTALQAIQEVQISEGGTFFVSKAGVLTYTSRRTRMQTLTSSATFGDGGGETPYIDITFDFDPTYVYNDVQITRTGGHAVSASDATSQQHYGQRTYSATLDIQSDSDAQDAANWILNTSLAPHVRVRSLTVDALATSGAWAALLPLEIGSRVTVNRRPFGGATITANAFVESIAWTIDASTARCTLEISPIPLQALIWDDSSNGKWDTNVWAW